MAGSVQGLALEEDSDVSDSGTIENLPGRMSLGVDPGSAPEKVAAIQAINPILDEMYDEEVTVDRAVALIRTHHMCVNGPAKGLLNRLKSYIKSCLPLASSTRLVKDHHKTSMKISTAVLIAIEQVKFSMDVV
jgi:hypothetical protein